MNDPIDLIDEALRAYVDRAAPLGIESRILARCRRRSWRWPVLGLAAAASGLMCVVWVRPGEPVRVAPARQFVMEDAVRNPGTVENGRAEASLHKGHGTGVQALWRFAQAHPDTVMAMAEDRQPEPVAPLQIEPIFIDELGDIEQ